MAELVLIAEDDAEIAGILQAYFTREGFRTVHARDGQVALDLHRTLKPTLSWPTSPCRGWMAGSFWRKSRGAAARP